MLLTLRGIRVSSVDWLSKKETLLKSCAGTRIRHARQWSSSRPIGLQTLRHREQVLEEVLLPRLDAKALSKAIFARKHLVNSPILLPLLKVPPSISCSLVSNEIRANFSQASMPVRALMEISATLMSFKLCATFSSTSKSLSSISRLLALMDAVCTVKRTRRQPEASGSSPKKPNSRLRFRYCLIRGSLQMKKYHRSATSTTMTSTHFELRQRL